MAASERRAGCTSPRPVFFTPGAMQLFHGEQLTANYQVNMGVKALDHVCGTGGGGKPAIMMESGTDASSHRSGKCDQT